MRGRREKMFGENYRTGSFEMCAAGQIYLFDEIKKN
jgi:hypothetical protein